MSDDLNISKKDLAFVKEYLNEKLSPVELDDLVFQLAVFKTSDTRKDRVKIYDPNCEYKLNDLIYKEYPGKIPTGAKKYIEVNKGVVLKVVEVKTRYGLEEIKLSYEGTSDFKKYTDYLTRQKIELLLPHKQGKPCKTAEFIKEEEDPRKKNAPLVQKELNLLKKKLITALNKEPEIALNSGKVLLHKNLRPIPAEIFDRIKEFLGENKKSESTEFFVENFIKIKPDSEEFSSYCFSLNNSMKNDYKIDFQLTKDIDWGKWNLISVIYYLKKESLISDENPLLKTINKVSIKNLGQKRKILDESLFGSDPYRFYLTQRELTSGALKLRSAFFDLPDSCEIEVIDSDTKKEYLLYYYADANLLLGLKEIYNHYKALQGMIISFEPAESGKYLFTIRTTKKGTISEEVSYDPENKIFTIDLDKKVASPVFVSKTIFLESDVFLKIEERSTEFKKIENFDKLLHKIFLEFGIKEKNYEIHILRLYHILDLIYPVDLKTVEDMILSNPEFVPSEKVPGVFYLDSEAVGEIEEEELQRRQVYVEEAKQRIEVQRQKKKEEELVKEEEIRAKREERRRKREEEMWAKERLKKEKLAQAPTGSSKKKKEVFSGAVPLSPEPDFSAGEISTEKKPRLKKEKKKYEVPKTEKVPTKKKEIKKSDEDFDPQELKDDIQLEELKETITTKKKQKIIEKPEKVAFKDTDDGVFGGVLASALDEIVKSDKDKPKKKPKK